jgi:hypothetical protein
MLFVCKVNPLVVVIQKLFDRMAFIKIDDGCWGIPADELKLAFGKVENILFMA